MSHQVPATREGASRAATMAPAVLTAMLAVALSFVTPATTRANLEASEHASAQDDDGGATMNQNITMDAQVGLLSETDGPMSTFGVRLLPGEFSVPVEEPNQSYSISQSLPSTPTPNLSLAPGPVAPATTPARRAKKQSRARAVFVLGDDPERGGKVVAPPSNLDPVGAPVQLTDEYLARILWFSL